MDVCLYVFACLSKMTHWLPNTMSKRCDWSYSLVLCYFDKFFLKLERISTSSIGTCWNKLDFLLSHILYYIIGNSFLENVRFTCFRAHFRTYSMVWGYFRMILVINSSNFEYFSKNCEIVLIWKFSNAFLTILYSTGQSIGFSVVTRAISRSLPVSLKMFDSCVCVHSFWYIQWKEVDHEVKI